jgi:endo-1,4-beta-xylanase
MKLPAKILILPLIAAISLPTTAQTVVPCDQTAKLSGGTNLPMNGNQGTGTLSGTDYHYEIWVDQGGASGAKLTWYGASQGGGAAFKAEWTEPDDYLGRIGYYWGNGGPYTQYNNIYCDFNYTRSGRSTAGDYSYIGIYGWTRNPLVEFYIVEDWFGNQWQADTGPLGTGTTQGEIIGNFTVDGGTYDIHKSTRTQKPSIDGTQTFTQIFSVRKTLRKCGTISVTEHFKKWAELGLPFGNKMYEAKFLAEAGGGTGWLDLSYLKFTQEEQPRGSVTPGNFTLTAIASPAAGGDVTKNPNNSSYAPNTNVTLTAAAKSGWTFSGWSGSGTSGTNATVTVKMDADKTVTATFTPTEGNTTNLIKNGNFANTQNWDLQTNQNSRGTFGVSGGAANITGITLPSGNDAAIYSLQLIQNGILLIHGQRYRLTFEASAASARTMSMFIQMDSSPYTTYFGKDDISLTAAWQPFTYDFEMTGPTDENARIAFNFGNATPNVNIRNVSLVYATDAPGTGVSQRNRPTAAGKFLSLRAAAQGSSVNVNFRAPASGEAALKLYTLKGDVISTAKVRTVAGGNYSHTFSPGKLPNGFYVVGLRSGGSVEQARVIIPR